MPNDSVNMEKHKNISAEYMRNYRKRKSQENKTPQASTSTDQTPTQIIYNYDQANEYIYSNTNPNLIPFSTLTLGTKVPQSFFERTKIENRIVMRNIIQQQLTYVESCIIIIILILIKKILQYQYSWEHSMIKIVHI
jgi:hypothetical protein